jgi:transcriptional enhancer factor
MSLKNNPVLVALASGLFPDVRPNYEYFAHLLSLNSTVAVRPKTCWEFVSSPDISLDEARTLRNRSGNLVDTSQYPQLRKSLQDGGNPQRGPDGSILLHEYTRSISQTFSTTTKEIAKLWEINFPALYENLNLPEPQDEDSLTILEMTTTLELHENHFPSGSELNGLIEMTIALPYLQSHRWKCLTRLARPKELCSDPENDPLVVEHTDEVAMQYTHQPGCSDGATGCDCMSRPRQDIRVPFPAAEWASMLTNCASYPETPSSERRRQAGHDDDSSLRSEVTQKELIAQIGMLQELWSCPPHSGKWTRQAVILWRFQDVHQFSPKKKKWVAEPAGTSWRFLTVNDPTSDYHMRNAYVSATSVNGSADTGGIASTGDHGSYNANDFPTWAEVGFPENQLRALGPAPPTGLDFGSFYHGLTTPPPTATLSSPYASSLEPSHDLNQSHQLSFLPTATACSTPVDSQTSSLLGDVPSTDHFLSASTAAVDVSGGAMGVGSYEEESDPTLHHWDGPVSALDAWTPSQYGVDASLTAAEKAAADWDGSTTRDWDKSWSPTGMSSMRAWDDGRGVVPGVVSVSPSPTLADSVARYSPRIKYSHAETGKIGSPTPPLKGNMQGVKRERTNSLDFEYEERKMRRVDGPGMREGGILGGHPTFGIAAGHEGTW